MAASKGLVLAANISSVANQAAMTWTGGRATLVILAATFPTSCYLQMLGPDNSTWCNINQTTISTNQVVSFDIPQGQVRLSLSGGSVSGLYANLVSVPYS